MPEEAGLWSMTTPGTAECSAARSTRTPTLASLNRRTTVRKLRQGRSLRCAGVFISRLIVQGLLIQAGSIQSEWSQMNRRGAMSAEKRARERGSKPTTFQWHTLLWLQLVSLRVYRVSAVQRDSL